MEFLFTEARAFVASSAFALTVDIMISWELVRFLSTEYLAAATITFLTGAVVAHQHSVMFAFERQRLRNRELKFLSFAPADGNGLTGDSIIIVFSVSYWRLRFLAAKCVEASFFFSCNFVARHQILSKVHRPDCRQS